MYASALCWRNQLRCLRIISQCLDAPCPTFLSSNVAITSAKKIQSCLLASSFVSITDSPLNLFLRSSVLLCFLVCSYYTFLVNRIILLYFGPIVNPLNRIFWTPPRLIVLDLGIALALSSVSDKLYRSTMLNVGHVSC